MQNWINLYLVYLYQTKSDLFKYLWNKLDIIEIHYIEFEQLRIFRLIKINRTPKEIIDSIILESTQKKNE